ncbi:MAG: HAD family hydrolase [Desulfobacterota bacterium]|nr:HAD family hydrolase [Thermodesulfobacteriota bacterium]
MGDLKISGVEAVLFDFEGTLVDHQWRRKEAVEEVLKGLLQLGLPVEGLRGRKYALLKHEAINLARALGRNPDEAGQLVDAVFDRFDEDALLRWNLRPMAKEFLSLLRRHQIRTGLVTNLGSKALRKGLQKLALDPLFDTLVSRDDVDHPKPNGEGIRLALGRLEVEKEKAFYIGDSLDDLQASKEAGVRVVIIVGGESASSEILSQGPDMVIEDYGELIGLFERERR